MAAYEPPVSRLLEIGAPNFGYRSKWHDYAAYGIGLEHVPELIRMMRDPDLDWGDEEKLSDYAIVHAWRALGQLKAEPSIEPLLDLIFDRHDFGELGDWVVEDVPTVVARIGPAAIAPTAARLARTHHMKYVPGGYARALAEIAENHPETRPEVVAQLVSFLDRAEDNDPEENAHVIGYLADLEAAEAWPAIERAYAGDRVETWICGSSDQVKFELGLGPKPSQTAWQLPPPSTLRALPSAKARADERARKRKAEKRKQKRRK